MRPLFLCLFSILFLTSCGFMGFRQVRGNGVRSSQQRTVRDFNRLEVSGSIDVVLAQGPASVRVEADENLLEYVEAEQSGSTLRVHFRNNLGYTSRDGIKVYITAPQYRSVQMTGSGDLTGTGRLSGNEIELELTGSGSMSLDLDMPRVRAQITGSGDARLSGATRDFEGEINGSGNLAAFGLLSEQTKIEVHGSGDAEVFASKQLDIDIAGSGDVAYKGTANVSKSVHGSGDVRKAD